MRRSSSWGSSNLDLVHQHISLLLYLHTPLSTRNQFYIHLLRFKIIKKKFSILQSVIASTAVTAFDQSVKERKRPQHDQRLDRLGNFACCLPFLLRIYFCFYEFGCVLFLLDDERCGIVVLFIDQNGDTFVVPCVIWNHVGEVYWHDIILPNVGNCLLAMENSKCLFWDWYDLWDN